MRICAPDMNVCRDSRSSASPMLDLFVAMHYDELPTLNYYWLDGLPGNKQTPTIIYYLRLTTALPEPTAFLYDHSTESSLIRKPSKVPGYEVNEAHTACFNVRPSGQASTLNQRLASFRPAIYGVGNWRSTGTRTIV